MIRFIAALAALSLTACSPTAGNVQSASSAAATVADAAGAPAPASVADKSVLDEQALTAIELAYKLARTAGELAVDAGLIKGERARQLITLDNQAYLAVTVARSAYSTANASSYRDALDSANAAVAAILPLIKGN